MDNFKKEKVISEVENFTKASKNMEDKDEKIQELQRNSLNNKVKLQIGYIGRLFGQKGHADINIVALTILFGFLLITVCLFILFYIKDISNEKREFANDLLLFLTNIVTLAFGYLFGQRRSS